MGIGTSTPDTELEVNGDLLVRDNANIGNSYKKLSIGSVPSSALGYGTSYIGFNAERTSVNNWVSIGDGYHNGGAVIYSTIFGDLIFSCIKSDGTGNQYLDDEGIHDKAKMILTKTGTLKTNEVRVKTNVWSDYVFDSDYKLKTIEEVEKFIKENKRLPDVPAEVDVIENGINLGEMDATLLRKIEELTLYVIELKKENEMMKGEIDKLKTK